MKNINKKRLLVITILLLIPFFIILFFRDPVATIICQEKVRIYKIKTPNYNLNYELNDVYTECLNEWGIVNPYVHVFYEPIFPRNDGKVY